ncbi:MAG: hypothetical protein GF329_14490 [Candidatus Lokiarchaeota archaeon]|nr:hypothetical protein [Candidatus Lokiarchaeota archaeon]
MSNSSNNTSINKYIKNNVENRLKDKKLSLINENIIQTLDLGKREKIIISSAQKIVNKNNVGFFYSDEIIKRISKKYKLKENPIEYIISLYQEGVIVPYKRKNSPIFGNTPSIVDPETSKIKESADHLSTTTQEKEIKAETIEKTSITTSDNVALSSSKDKIDREIEEIAPEPISIPQNKVNKEKINKIKISPQERQDLLVPKDTEKIKSKTLLGVQLDEKKSSTTPKEEEISDKKKYAKENIKGLMKLRKEHLGKTQNLVNHFNFLDSLAELEEVIEISEVMGDEKAVKLYRKQSESILQLGLKYEEIIDKVKADSEYRKKVETMLEKKLSDVKKYWKNNDHKNVYSTLKEAAKLSYYLENTDDAIIYSDQAEAMKHKIKES